MTYAALTPETLPRRLGDLPALTDRIGPPDRWRVAEVGDGNLNLVFIVTGDLGQIIVKQALPYIRLVGDSWPLPLNRAFFEYHALMRQAARDPDRVPEVFHFDEGQALIVMRYLSPHVILRKSIVRGVMHPNLAQHMGVFLGRNLFRGSALSLTGQVLRGGHA
jgi:5-methylthioribose kinase